MGGHVRVINVEAVHVNGLDRGEVRSVVDAHVHIVHAQPDDVQHELDEQDGRRQHADEIEDLLRHLER